MLLINLAIWRDTKSKHEGIRYPCDQCEYAATHSLAVWKIHKAYELAIRDHYVIMRSHADPSVWKGIENLNMKVLDIHVTNANTLA